MVEQANKLDPILVWHTFMIGSQPPTRAQLAIDKQAKGDIGIADIDRK
jgi:hypothetical protein